jgi:hypothetical protein
MAEVEAWEIDVQMLTLNDLIALEEADVNKSARQVRDLLGRLVTNKTAEEIGQIPFSELDQHLAQVRRTIEELAIPKESTTP